MAVDIALKKKPTVRNLSCQKGQSAVFRRPMCKNVSRGQE
jgi:hypothetical protein